MEENKSKQPVWFRITAIGMLIWNIMGIMAFFQHVLISEEALQLLPDNEKQVYLNTPIWVQIAFAVAVFGSTLGCIALLLRKAAARVIFIISFVAILVQMIYNLFIAGALEVYGPGATVMPALIILFSLILIRISGLGIKKGWLK